MSSRERLEELLLAWQEAQAQGTNVDPEQLCQHDPHLVVTLSRHIAAVQQVQRLATLLHRPEEDSATGADAPTGPALSPSAEPSLAPGVQLAGYTLEGLLGAGGMGEVYRAFDPHLHRSVALKVMRPDLAQNPLARERFLREARAVAALTDDHVVTIHAVGEEAGRLYLVMPLLRGETLQTRLKREGCLSMTEALRITREAAQGLETAHRLGLVHRDVKPSNLWLEAGTDRVKLLDFGLARDERTVGLTHSGAFCGTPGYAAPEQIDGAPPAVAADLFSLGCVLYRMLTGKEAFPGSTPTAMLLAVARCEPVSPAFANPSLPASVCALVVRLLQRDPEERPASAAALITDIINLQKFLSAADTLPAKAPVAPGVTVPPLPAPSPATIPARWRIVGGGLAAVLLLGLLAWLGIAALRPAATPSGGIPPVAQGSLQGDIDLLVWKAQEAREGPQGPGKRLALPGVLPLQQRDWMRIEVTLARPAYVYVIWLEASGKAVPIFPWKGRRWDERSPEESRKVLMLPQTDVASAAPLGGGPTGVEVILLLVREDPLPVGAETQLQEVLARSWQPPTLAKGGDFAVWLENGEAAREQGRGAILTEETRPILNPVLQTQQLLRRDLQPWFGYSRAVCYGFQGK